MTDLHTIVSIVIFSLVIVTIVFDIFDLVVAGLLGVSGLIIFGIVELDDIARIVRTSGATFALLFGGMVVARTLKPTGIFESLGDLFLKRTHGSGKRFLIGLIVLVAPLCMFLPNATTVLLLAPVIVRVARALEVDFVPPLVLTAIVSNSAGLLTLVGDPATFLVGSAINMTFLQYLYRVAPGGFMTLLVIVPLLPWIMKDVWNKRVVLAADLEPRPLVGVLRATLSLSVLLVMILLFLFGDRFPVSIAPAAASIIACSLALLVIQSIALEPISDVLRDIDWKTIVFIACMFVLVEALAKTGLLHKCAGILSESFGTNLAAAAIALLAGIGIASGFLANIPVVAAAILLVKGFLVINNTVTEQALGASFADWPLGALPVFIALMFGGTLGGNVTLIGASANLVAAGIASQNKNPIRFSVFARYGAPIACCQLFIAALYIWLMSLFQGN